MVSITYCEYFDKSEFLSVDLVTKSQTAIHKVQKSCVNKTTKKLDNFSIIL